MRNIPYILLFISILYCCDLKKSEKVERIKNVDDCPLIDYVVDLPNNTQIKSVYFECESDLKFKLQILRNQKLIFEADTITKYEFNEYVYPTYILNEDYEYLLIEENDTAILNKMNVLRLKDNQVDSVFRIPHFESKGIDIDNDGITEYWSIMEMVNRNGSGTIGYNPILVYEIEKDLFKFDISTTILLNEEVYGQYHGLEIIDTLFFNGNKVEEKWPYPH